MKRRILIGSLNGPYFAKRIAKMDHSRTDFSDCFLKRYSKEHFFVQDRNIFLVVCLNILA